jgi:hypothetical protein
MSSYRKLLIDLDAQCSELTCSGSQLFLEGNQSPQSTIPLFLSPRTEVEYFGQNYNVDSFSMISMSRRLVYVTCGLVARQQSGEYFAVSSYSYIIDLDSWLAALATEAYLELQEVSTLNDLTARTERNELNTPTLDDYHPFHYE